MVSVSRLDVSGALVHLGNFIRTLDLHQRTYEKYIIDMDINSIMEPGYQDGFLVHVEARYHSLVTPYVCGSLFADELPPEHQNLAEHKYSQPFKILLRQLVLKLLGLPPGVFSRQFG